MKNELVVYQKRALKRSILPAFLLIVWGVLAFSALYVKEFKQQWWGIYIALSITLVFLVLCVYQLYRLVNYLNQPYLIINRNGLWSKNHGLIPWNNILLMQEIEGPQPKHAWLFKRLRRQYLGIKLKDSSAIKPLQGAFDEQLCMIQSNYWYDIMLSDFDVPSKEIVDFAQNKAICNLNH